MRNKADRRKLSVGICGKLAVNVSILVHSRIRDPERLKLTNKLGTKHLLLFCGRNGVALLTRHSGK